MHRRWQTEFEQLGPCAQRDGDNIIYLLLTFADYEKHAVVKFDRQHCNFPFRPIKATVLHGGEYVDYFEVIRSLHSNPDASRLTEQVLGTKCLVCDSILCTNTWSPQTKLVMVRDEIAKGLRLKLRHGNRLMVRLLNPRVTKLHDEVWRYIETFL